MNGNEFIKRVKKLAKVKGLSFEVNKERGKGNHITLCYGDRHTVLRNPKDELKNRYLPRHVETTWH